MNLLYLKYALEVAKTHSINKAAENLFMAQPNLSRAIKELEASLGIAIFERSPRGMLVTPKGELFLQQAQKLLRQCDALETMFQNEGAERQTFSLALPRSGYLADAFAEFVRSVDRSRPLEILYKETGPLDTVELVTRTDYRLGIVRYDARYDRYFKDLLADKGLDSVMIAEFSYRLLFSRRHPLADRETVSLRDLSSYIEIAHAEAEAAILPDTAKKGEHAGPNERRILVYDRAAVCELLDRSPDTFAWSPPLPDTLLARYQLVQRSCTDQLRRYKDVLIYRKNYRMTELDHRFITLLCDTKRALL